MRSEQQVKAQEKSLRSLAALLKKKPMTAKQVAAHFGCTKVTAYVWIRALPDLGFRLKTSTEKEEGVTGPAALTYSIPPPRKKPEKAAAKTARKQADKTATKKRTTARKKT
jgi:transposase